MCSVAIFRARVVSIVVDIVSLHIGDEGDQDHDKFNSRRCSEFFFSNHLTRHYKSESTIITWASEPVRQVRRPPDQYFPKINILMMN